jgi:hypothetical protein
MMTQHRKLIATAVLVAFLCLAQSASAPLRAEPAAARQGSSLESREQTPRVLEQQGSVSAPAKRKSLLPILIGVAAAGAVAAVLVLVVFKTRYDITGNWDYSWKYAGDSEWRYAGQRVTFSGDRKSGTLTYRGYPGAYVANGKNVAFVFAYQSDNTVTNSGRFAGQDKLSGTWKMDQDASVNGSWEMVRASVTAQVCLPQAAGGTPGKSGGH